MFKLKF